ncbi:hypothetical protein K443DRAFT_199634 [Laccaria amethystina LaAM-08-1]|uniref:Uncharacterized protein n=1 Tax=Laccaria amethystina LaAM-08-1 TaxID=1095629 RepID=A0A0C9XQ61_9AGAR|nr:hypothetical protein K443DRAFT_199634 [Laccaria amethystina LaAM-08-1]
MQPRVASRLKASDPHSYYPITSSAGQLSASFREITGDTSEHGQLPCQAPMQVATMMLKETWN